MKYTLPELPYSYDAMEPFIDGPTMRVHHQGHHRAYVEELNKSLENHPELQLKVEDLLARLETLPAELRTAVANNAGGHANHTLFWTLLVPPARRAELEPEGDVGRAINKEFGNFRTFQEKFSKLATEHFSNGWAWLGVESTGEMSVFTTKDHESPLARGVTPLLVLDLWEHAYYLNYQNRRKEYVTAFWNVVNWKEVGMRWSEFSRNGNTNREWQIAS